MRKFFQILSTVILLILVAVVIIVFIARANGKSPTIFGFTVFRVSSDSMVPSLNVGDIIMDQKVDPEDIKIGDIVSYTCLDGKLKGQTITHRVVKGPISRNGEYSYITKGDKEGAVEDAEISYDQIEGKYLYTMSWLNGVYTFFLSPGGLITFIGIIVFLFGYEMITLIIAYKTADEKDEDYYEPKAKKESKKRKKQKKTHLKK